ncbi:MAG: endonuclease 4 [Gemmatimonadetes bacterium]|nr:endonuclease 4 [Gemmatimonadota bacterium]
MTHYFGAHTVDAGGIHMAARRASSAGMRALQIFTAIPKYYNDKVSIKAERVTRFRETLASTSISPEHVVVHAAYVLNTATPDEAKWVRARDGLTRELARSTALGVGAVCFHPGAATDDDRDGAAERIASTIIHALKEVSGDTRLLVENTAGAGRTMGRTPEEVGAILAHIPQRLRSRTGYGLDTCHLFASGFDLTESAVATARILDAFEEATGEAPGFFHLNDSEGALGSNKDRHRLLGEGLIGTEAFRWILADKRARNIPLILETPQLNYEIADDDDSADPYDLQMMALLRSLL